MPDINFAMKEKRRGRKMQMRTDEADFPFPYSSRYFPAALRDARNYLCQQKQEKQERPETTNNNKI